MTIFECEKKIQKYMEACLAVGYNQKLSAKKGSDWFEKLVKEEKHQDAPVINRKQKTIYQCDLQALLKLPRYRDEYRYAIFPDRIQYKREGTDENNEDRKLLTILQSLIDFRNDEIGHPYVLEEKIYKPGEYDFDHAIMDMMTLLSYFPKVRGREPRWEDRSRQTDKAVCYYEEAQKVYEQYKKENGQVDYSVDEMIKKHNLDLTTDMFVAACKDLCIPNLCTREGIWYFCSADPERDVRNVREYYRTKEIEQEKEMAERARQKAEQEKQEAERKALQAEQDAQKRVLQAESRVRNKKAYILIGAGILAAILILAGIIAGAKQAMSGLDGLTGIFGTGSSKTDAQIQEEIENFVPDAFNNFLLRVGETHTPKGKVWLNGGSGGSCYSTDESVVTVTSGGIVKAVGEGEAFVVVKGVGDMYAITRYTVQDE